MPSSTASSAAPKTGRSFMIGYSLAGSTRCQNSRRGRLASGSRRGCDGIGAGFGRLSRREGTAGGRRRVGVASAPPAQNAPGRRALPARRTFPHLRLSNSAPACYGRWSGGYRRCQSEGCRP